MKKYIFAFLIIALIAALALHQFIVHRAFFELSDIINHETVIIGLAALLVGVVVAKAKRVF